VATVKQKLSKQCQSIKVHDVKPVTLPVAKDSQQYLICSNYQQGLVGEVAFVFGDHKLKMVEANDGIIEALKGKMSEQPMAFMHYKIDMKQFIIAEPANDNAWLLNMETLHPHLFLWPNSHLTANKDKKALYVSGVAVPAVLPFGKKLSEVKPLLEQHCKLTYLEHIDKVWLANKPAKQIQVNCFGYDFAGFSRKIEAVFGDDILQQAWILTAKAEEDRIRQMLTQRYGKPVYVSDDYETFNHWQISLRKDKPEVLMVSKELAGIFEKRFGG
jgi:hypothetical protein